MAAPASPPLSSVLHLFHEVLKYAGLATELVGISPGHAFEELFVAVRPGDEAVTEAEESRQTHGVQIFFVNDVIEAAQLPELNDAEDSTQMLQFLAFLPLKLTAEKLLDLCFLLLNLNNLLPLGSFGFTHDQGIFLKYMLILKEKESFDPLVGLEIVELMGFFLNQLGPRILAFMQGSESVEQILRETEQQFQTLPARQR